MLILKHLKYSLYFNFFIQFQIIKYSDRVKIDIFLHVDVWEINQHQKQ